MTIEQKIISYISDIGVPAYTERPKKPDGEFIIIERLSGEEHDFVTQAQISIRSVSTTMSKAAALSHKVVEAMRGFSDTVNVGFCALNNQSNDTDTEMHEYRYQAIFDVDYMED